jgi:hypothetical protein
VCLELPKHLDTLRIFVPVQEHGPDLLFEQCAEVGPGRLSGTGGVRDKMKSLFATLRSSAAGRTRIVLLTAPTSAFRSRIS